MNVKELSIDRRETERLPISARVVHKDGNQEEIYFSDDLSLGGLFLKTERPPVIGTTFNLEIAVPGISDLIKAKGEVMWRHEGRGCGVRFIRMTAQNKKILKNYLDLAAKK